MAVLYDQKRKLFYIQFYRRSNDSKCLKKIKIRNSSRTKELGKKYVKNIEQNEIALYAQTHPVTKKRLLVYTFSDLVKDFLTLENRTKKLNTAYNKEIVIRKHIAPYLGEYQTLDTSFTEEHIKRLIKALENYKEINTVDRRNYVIRVTRQLIDFAFNLDKISQTLNLRMTRSLPFFSKGLEPSRDLNYRTYEERSKFILTFTENDRWRLLFETCYYGALRIGELIGLKRKDFKAVNKTIYVDNQVDRSGNITSLKTESSRSLVDLPTFLVDELENYRIKSKALDEEFMFFFKKTSRTTIRRKMDEHIKLAGVKKITVHGLRHSCASMMINSGVNVLYISQHLRHKSTQQTLDTYSHLFPSNSYGIMDNVFEKITPVLTPKTNPQK